MARALTLDMYTPDMDVADETAKKHVEESLALAAQALVDFPSELACFAIDVRLCFKGLARFGGCLSRSR